MANVQSIPSTITSGSQGRATSFRGNVRNTFHPLELSPFYLLGPKGYDDGIWSGSERNLAASIDVLTNPLNDDGSPKFTNADDFQIIAGQADDAWYSADDRTYFVRVRELLPASFSSDPIVWQNKFIMGDGNVFTGAFCVLEDGRYKIYWYDFVNDAESAVKLDVTDKVASGEVFSFFGRKTSGLLEARLNDDDWTAGDTVGSSGGGGALIVGFGISCTITHLGTFSRSIRTDEADRIHDWMNP